MLWLVFAAITLLVLTLLLRPLLARNGGSVARIGYDLAVYRDQLAELERDRERGLLDTSQAEAARVEIQRRILAAEEAEGFVSASAGQHRQGRRRWITAVILAVALPGGALGLYAWLGHPALPGQPFASRKDDPAFKAEEMIVHIETEMRRAPTARGLKMLGDLQSSRGHFDQAAAAYRAAIAQGARDGDTFSSLGEAIVMQNDGGVTPEARAHFLAALKADSAEPRARFYLGLAEAEIGEYRKAVAIWRDLERDSKADAPWLPMLKERIAVFSKEGGFSPDRIEPAAPAVTADAGEIPSNQQQMIQAMVERLAAKMAADPGNLDGWLRLARAYKVLGDAANSENAKSQAAKLIAALPPGTKKDSAQETLDALAN